MADLRVSRLAFAVACMLGAGGFARLAAAADDERNVNVRVAERLTEEDNLYRLPEGVDPALFLGPDARREDLVSSTSLALDARWRKGEQGVVLDANVAANRFADNGDLDNTSGRGALDWNWRLAKRWTGQIGAKRERTLAGFANTLLLEKDVYDTGTYYADTRFALGPRWRAFANARTATTEHDNASRRRDDVEIDAGSVGMEYRSPSANTLAWDVRSTRAVFPEQAPLGGAGSPSDYEEKSANFAIGYALTDEVALRGTVGRVERTYELAPAGDFEGGVWSAAVQWLPTKATQIAFKRFRELKAHLDAESDHFVSDGESVTATWAPTLKVALSVEIAREEQAYIGADVDLLVESSREDTPATAALRLTYSPRERATIEVAYRGETRESNRARFDYDAAALSVAAEVRF
jgi:hypothetical protein